MPIVKININSKNYEIECAAGEEEQLSSAVKKLTSIIDQFSEIKKLPDSKMFLMSSILLAEESINKDSILKGNKESYKIIDEKLLKLEKIVKENVK
tara:strand:+ start:1993 stop:2280 length:288 start_codon:yes stop_codon:yes gene_type:complete